MADDDQPKRPRNPFTDSARGGDREAARKLSIGSIIQSHQYDFSEEELEAIGAAIDARDYKMLKEGVLITIDGAEIELPFSSEPKISKAYVQSLMGSLTVDELERMVDNDEIDPTLTKTQILFELRDVHIAAQRANEKLNRSAKLQEALHPEVDGRPVRYITEEQYDRLGLEGGVDKENRYYVFLQHPQEQIIGLDVTEKDGTLICSPDGQFRGPGGAEDDQPTEISAEPGDDHTELYSDGGPDGGDGGPSIIP
ncbi:hypothetical protein N9Z27_01280 [Alphaproteobacteria bacterium]|nr:hypothetical protein [Alphaproteobacteria bacterium]